MADVELVIKIPEEIYKSCKKECDENDSLIIDTFTYAIGNGTPLPKGRGRLIILSEDVVKREQIPFSFSCQNWLSEVGLAMATISVIEADKEENNAE